MASKNKNIVRTMSAETDDKFAAGKAVEQMVRRIVRAGQVTDIDYVLVLSGGKLGVTPVSNFKVDYTLRVTATPSGATVTLNGVESDTVTVLAGSSVLVEVTADGYLPYSTTVIMNSDKELSVALVEDYLVVTPQEYTLEPQGGIETEKITVSTPGAWYAAVSPLVSDPWVHLSQDSGEGDAEITLEHDENTSEDERSCKIRFVSQTGIAAEVTVTQAARVEEELSVSPTSVTLDYEGGSFTLNITSNTTWNIEYTGESQLGFSQTSGEGNATVTVTYPQNPSTTDRPTMTIYVRTASGEKSASVSLTQNAAEPAVTISPQSAEVTLGNQLTFQVSVNEYTDYLQVNVNGWNDGSGGITSVSMQGSESHYVTENGKYSVKPGDSFYMIVSTTKGSDSGTYRATMQITLTPYNGNQAGTTAQAEITIG